WFLAPCLMMLTYGWVFHMGFSNYYLASGLSIWAVVLSMRRGAPALLASTGLLIAAYTAHAIPLAWAIGVIAYSRISKGLSWRRRQLLMVLAVASILGLRWWIIDRFHAHTTFHQTLETSGVDQVWVFGHKYIAISVGLGMLWGFLLLRISYLKGARGMFGDAYFQICILTGLFILLIPSSIELPQYALALSFITERMTLLHGVLICAFLARADPPRWICIWPVPLAMIYFSLIYADTKALNDVERKMEILTNNLTLRDRVISSFVDPTSRVQLWGHNLDRVCLGKCNSYANYEPVTLQFL